MAAQSVNKSVRRSTWLFVLFLLLGGLLHWNEYAEHPYLPSTPVYLLVFAIYAALLLCWLQSLRERLLRSAVREYVLLAGLLMLCYLIIRTFKYRVEAREALIRYLWYGYYVPIIGIPTLFLMTCICFYRTALAPSWEIALTVPAAALILGVMTNDLHSLAFRPYGEIALLWGATGTYAYGLIFYAACVWIGICVLLGVLLLLLLAREKHDWKKAVLPLLFLAAIPALINLRRLLNQAGLRRPYEEPEIYIFCMLGMLETCIRIHLLPGNGDYLGFFGGMNIPVCITDDKLITVYETASPLHAPEGLLREALSRPVPLDENTYLLGKRLRAGNAFWVVDEGPLRRLTEQLEDANEIIGLENDLIRYEREQAEQKARFDAGNAAYGKAEDSLRTVRRKITDLLKKAQPDTPEGRRYIARVLSLIGFVKRKTNFILSYGEDEKVPPEELFRALKEMTGFLNDCGLNASVKRQDAVAFTCRQTVALFDCFELLTDCLLPVATWMLVSLRRDGLRLTVDCPPLKALPEMALPVSQQLEEDMLIISLPVKEGGGAA